MGSSQLAYSSKNEQGIYGSFDALQAELLIAPGYTPGNIVENYSMTWDVSNLSTVGPEGIISTFTIVAHPESRMRIYLETFCVTDDQVVRVYNPESGNKYEDIYHWDPIL